MHAAFRRVGASIAREDGMTLLQNHFFDKALPRIRPGIQVSQPRERRSRKIALVHFIATADLWAALGSLL